MIFSGCRFGSAKRFWPSVFAQFAGKRKAKLNTPATEESINYDPGGLLLVVSHLFAIAALVLWVPLEKSK